MIRGTALILDGIVSALQALTWTPNEGLPEEGAPEPLFGSVQRTASTDIEKAFRSLLISSQRAALVVCTGNEWEEIPMGTQRAARRTSQISVIVTDRVIGRTDAATFGAADTPGAWGLADRVSDALIGRVLANPRGVDLVPRHTYEVTINDESNPNLPARAVGVIELDAIGGMVAGSNQPLGPVA